MHCVGLGAKCPAPSGTAAWLAGISPKASLLHLAPAGPGHRPACYSGRPRPRTANAALPITFACTAHTHARHGNGMHGTCLPDAHRGHEMHGACPLLSGGHVTQDSSPPWPRQLLCTRIRHMPAICMTMGCMALAWRMPTVATAWHAMTLCTAHAHAQAHACHGRGMHGECPTTAMPPWYAQFALRRLALWMPRVLTPNKNLPYV